MSLAGFDLVVSHLGHNSLSLEASAHAVVDTLWLSPARVDAHEAVRLVAVEARSAYKKTLSATSILNLSPPPHCPSIVSSVRSFFLSVVSSEAM